MDEPAQILSFSIETEDGLHTSPSPLWEEVKTLAPLFPLVTTGLVPVVHSICVAACSIGHGMDARNKSGHDERKRSEKTNETRPQIADSR